MKSIILTGQKNEENWCFWFIYLAVYLCEKTSQEMTPFLRTQKKRNSKTHHMEQKIRLKKSHGWKGFWSFNVCLIRHHKKLSIIQKSTYLYILYKDEKWNCGIWNWINILEWCENVFTRTKLCPFSPTHNSRWWWHTGR